MLPKNGEIPLALIPRRWHLFPETTAVKGHASYKRRIPVLTQTIYYAENTATDNAEDKSILAITDAYSAPTVDDQIAVELTRINSLAHKLADQQQSVSLLNRLKSIEDDLFFDIKELQKPSDTKASSSTRSKKRENIRLEHLERESKKKAKTGVGREAAEIWYSCIYDAYI